jgi:predicted Zn-dependent peptidase
MVTVSAKETGTQVSVRDRSGVVRTIGDPPSTAIATKTLKGKFNFAGNVNDTVSFTGSMASITFQTIRESKALAYAVWSSYRAPDKKEDPYNIFAYVGSQADKSPETMKSMFELLTDMPRADKLFEQSKTSLVNDLASERTTRENILWSYERARKLGLDHDIRQDIYASAPNISFDQISDFQKQYIRGHQYAIAVLGSKDKVDMKDLSKYGNVQTLSLEEIFGY